MFTELCDYHHSKIWDIHIISKRNFCPLAIVLNFPLPQTPTLQA